MTGSIKTAEMSINTREETLFRWVEQRGIISDRNDADNGSVWRMSLEPRQAVGRQAVGLRQRWADR